MRGYIVAAVFAIGIMPATAQYLPSYQNPPSTAAQGPVQAAPSPTVPAPTAIPQQIAQDAETVTTASPDVQRLLVFRDSDIKFDVEQMMDVLRDKRHEGWVLVAYPDPKTSQPLIGAGFSLDLPARVHPQRDPLNPNQFLEPSSAELWQAAGLPPQKLQAILAQFHSRTGAWSRYEFRVQMKQVDPQITPEEANALLRMGVIQAAMNAKAYCRYFNQMTASQQMALSQLVYQMGVNLEEFTTFLSLINRQETDEAGNVVAVRPDAVYWHDVQKSLVASQWARLYRDRAKAVIAMFDPHYELNPEGAEHRVGIVVRPSRRRGRGARGGAHGGSLREADMRGHHSSAARRRNARRRRD